MQINFTKRFAKQRDKAPTKIQKSLNTKLELFIMDPFNGQLDNHPLKGRLKPYRSIDITGDWRAWYVEVDDVAWFDVLGTHSQLYR